MKKRLNLQMKSDTFEKLKELCEDSGIHNPQVYMTKKLIVGYGKRIREGNDHASNPIPQSLAHNVNFKDVHQHLMLDELEWNYLEKLISYHYFISSQTGKPQYSKFMACLICYQYEKKFGVKKQKATKESFREKIDPSLLDPVRYGSHDGEDWSGER